MEWQKNICGGTLQLQSFLNLFPKRGRMPKCSIMPHLEGLGHGIQVQRQQDRDPLLAPSSEFKFCALGDDLSIVRRVAEIARQAGLADSQ